jgi:uncharacterized protein (DUF433 family)
MSNAKLRLMVAVFARRMANGETFKEVAADYQKLTAEDLEQIREALNQ